MGDDEPTLYARPVAGTAERPRRRRRWLRRRGLPRSRRALALGALVAVVILVLLLLGIARARPGQEVPFYDPSITTTTAPRGPLVPPSITTIPAAAPAPTQAITSTTRRRR